MTDKEALDLYRAAIRSAREQGLLIPTVIEMAEWSDLKRDSKPTPADSAYL